MTAVHNGNISREIRHGRASMTVDTRGGVITSLILPPDEGGKGQPRELLYADTATLGTSKPRATHFMMPVGPDGSGGKHGPIRRTEALLGVQESRSGYEHLSMYLGCTGSMRVDYVRRDVNLHGTSVEITTQVVPIEDRLTSLGEHFYFGLGGASLADICIGNQPLESVLGDQALEGIEDGKPALWTGFNGIAAITFPHQEQPHGGLVIMANASIGEQTTMPDAHAMLFWREPTTNGVTPDYLCMEPVVGVIERDGQFINDQLVVRAGQCAAYSLMVMAPNHS